jgi:hypothetical protein
MKGHEKRPQIDPQITQITQIKSLESGRQKIMRHGDTEMGGRGEFGIVRGFLRVAASPRPCVGSFAQSV